MKIYIQMTHGGIFNAESEYKDVKGVHPNKTIDINLWTDDQTGEKFLSLYPVDEHGQTDCTKSLGFYKLRGGAIVSIPKTRTHKSVIGQLRKKYGLKDNTPIHKVEQIMTPKIGRRSAKR